MKNFVENISPAIEFSQFLKLVQKLPKTSKWLIYGTALTAALGRKQAVIFSGKELQDLFVKVDPNTKWRFNSDKTALIKNIGNQFEVTEASRIE